MSDIDRQLAATPLQAYDHEVAVTRAAGRMPAEFILVDKDGREGLREILAQLRAAGVAVDDPARWWMSKIVARAVGAEAVPLPGIAWNPGISFWGVHHQGRLLAAGEREFRLSPGLADSLMVTELRGVEATSLRLPYEAFIVRVPKSCKIETWNPDERGWCQVGAISVTSWDTGDRRELISRTGVPCSRVLSLFMMGDLSDPANSRSAVDTFVNMGVADGDRVEDVVARIVSDRKHEDRVRLRASDGGERVDPMELVVRLALNTILYINLPQADIVQDGLTELQKLREQARRHPKGSHKHERTMGKVREAEKKARVFKLGGSIKIPNEMSEAANAESRGQRSYLASWLVRGHWRNQAKGKGRAEHELIWIKPSVRRRDLGAVLEQRPYEVS